MTSMIVKELKQQFSNDLLYIYLQKAGFKEEELFPSFLDRVSMEDVYSILEIVEMFQVNDNNLRYQMKVMRKAGYIDSILAGRNYRFDYLNIYRMYLVVLVLSLPGRNTRDVLNVLKEKQPEAVEKETTKIEEGNSVKNDLAKMIDTSRNELEIEILNKQILINELQMKINELYKSFLQLDHRFNLSVLENGVFSKVYEVLLIKNGFCVQMSQNFFLLMLNCQINSEQ